MYISSILYFAHKDKCVLSVELIFWCFWVNDSFKQPVYEIINQCIYLLFRNKD